MLFIERYESQTPILPGSNSQQMFILEKHLQNQYNYPLMWKLSWLKWEINCKKCRFLNKYWNIVAIVKAHCKTWLIQSGLDCVPFGITALSKELLQFVLLQLLFHLRFDWHIFSYVSVHIHVLLNITETTILSTVGHSQYIIILIYYQYH